MNFVKTGIAVLAISTAASVGVMAYHAHHGTNVGNILLDSIETKLNEYPALQEQYLKNNEEIAKNASPLTYFSELVGEAAHIAQALPDSEKQTKQTCETLLRDYNEHIRRIYLCMYPALVLGCGLGACIGWQQRKNNFLNEQGTQHQEHPALD